jgi:hypothetical protein
MPEDIKKVGRRTLKFCIDRYFVMYRKVRCREFLKGDKLKEVLWMKIMPYHEDRSKKEEMNVRY